MNVDYNPFESRVIRGRPHTVTVRGQIAVREGRFLGSAGWGRFVAREPHHAS
jgi:dihydropyrimidinase